MNLFNLHARPPLPPRRQKSFQKISSPHVALFLVTFSSTRATELAHAAGSCLQELGFLGFHLGELDHGDFFSNEWNTTHGVYAHTFRNWDANNSGSGGAGNFIETQHHHVSFRGNTLRVDRTGDAINSGGGGIHAGKFIQANRRHY
jgi:hypothetical protein